jgi:hypothetical protein
MVLSVRVLIILRIRLRIHVSLILKKNIKFKYLKRCTRKHLVLKDKGNTKNFDVQSSTSTHSHQWFPNSSNATVSFQPIKTAV